MTKNFLRTHYVRAVLLVILSVMFALPWTRVLTVVCQRITGSAYPSDAYFIFLPVFFFWLYVFLPVVFEFDQSHLGPFWEFITQVVLLVAIAFLIAGTATGVIIKIVPTAQMNVMSIFSSQFAATLYVANKIVAAIRPYV